MNPELDPRIAGFLFLTAPVAAFALVAGLEYVFKAWARRVRAANSQATRGLSASDRALRRSALHLARERDRAIADLGTDWVLHPKHKRGEK